MIYKELNLKIFIILISYVVILLSDSLYQNYSTKLFRDDNATEIIEIVEIKIKSCEESTLELVECVGDGRYTYDDERYRDFEMFVHYKITYNQKTLEITIEEKADENFIPKKGYVSDNKSEYYGLFKGLISEDFKSIKGDYVYTQLTTGNERKLKFNFEVFN